MKGSVSAGQREEDLPHSFTNLPIDDSVIRPVNNNAASTPNFLPHSRWVVCASLAIAYLATGRLGLLLAIPPGYATAIFLPAGIAVGGMYVAGTVMLPATLVASFVLNVWIGYLVVPHFEVVSVIAAVAIAFSSALQAAVGGMLLRRVIGYPTALDNAHDILLFLGLSPAFCLTSATLSVCAIWALGTIGSDEVTINWLTWWVGDTLGVVVTVPLILVVFGRSSKLWRSRALFVALPTALCFALFVVIFIRVSNWENEQSLLEFRLRSQQLADTIKGTLNEQATFLDQLANSFVTRREVVSRQDFRSLVNKLLQRFPTIQAVEWAPRVMSSDRATFEASQQPDIAGFVIRQLGASGALEVAADRKEYYPVTYVEPLADNGAAVGYDLASDADRATTIDMAMATGNVTATAPIRLVQERGEQAGLLLGQAVAGGPMGPGIVLVVLRMGTFAENLANPNVRTLRLRFSDASAQRPFFDQVPPSMLAPYESAFEVGSRHYLIQTAPSAVYLATHRGWESWAVLAAGLLGTGLIGALLLLGTGQAYRFEQLAGRLRANEVSLREREVELQTIIYRSPFMLVRVSRELRYRFISQAHADVTGRKPDEVVGKTMREVMGDETFNEILPFIEEVLQGKRVEFEREFRFPKIGPRFLRVAYTPEFDEQGAVAGWIATMLDITEQKRLHQLTEHLETEVENRTRERDRTWNVSEDLLGVANFEGYFTSINPAWTKLLGWSENEIKSMHVTELRHPDDAAHSVVGRARLAEGVPTVRMENRFRTKDGSWRWISWTMTAEDGLIYVAGRHTTLEKEAAAALEQAQRQAAHSQKMEALGQLTGGVAHDFNNLLMIVSGHAQSLIRKLADPKALRALEAIRIAASRGENLTRQLLAFSRNQPLNPTVVAPKEAVDAIRDVLSGSLDANIRMSIDIPETIWLVHVDRAELELALVNLVVNARDAMPGGGQLIIQAENVVLKPNDTSEGISGEFVALSVSDTGVGISNENILKVFEPFFTTKAQGKGTGLGLSQVYGFGRRSGGSVVIASEEGHGTKATVYLPRSRAKEADPPPLDDQNDYRASGHETILIVEDNHEVRAVAVSLLDQLGYRTVAVETAAEALTTLECNPSINLLFSDIVLPGDCDGLTLARRAITRRPDLVIVLTTGYVKSFDSDPEFLVLRKPYQISALGRAIRQGLERTQEATTE